METALNVDRQHLERLLPFIHQYIIDIKDVNPDIYQHYTGMENQRVINNLRWLLDHDGMTERIIVKLPLIPDFNTPEDVKSSRQCLEKMGIINFNEFEYQRVSQQK